MFLKRVLKIFIVFVVLFSILLVRKQENNVIEKSTFSKRIKFKGIFFDTYVVDLWENKVKFFWKDNQGQNLSNFQNLKIFLENKNQVLLFATNAGIYSPKNTPLGLYIENSRELSPINLQNGVGNFYLKPNGIFFISNKGARIVQSSSYSYLTEDITFATQSGPLLLRNGKLHSKFNRTSKNRYIRNGVGIINPKKIVFVISNEKINLYYFASFFKEKFNCKNALYLDGFVSKMYLPELNRFDLRGTFTGMIAVSKKKK